MPHRRRLRSASTEQLDLDLPNCRRSTIGGRAFPVAGTKVWNGLPSDVRLYVGLVAVSFQEQAEDILVPPLLRNCLTLNYITLQGSGPPQPRPGRLVIFV